MTIIVFGATGMVGKQLVQQALFKGHTVKAFGRNVFSEYEPETKNLELVKGALFDAGEVADAIKGCNAVLSALGGGFDGNDKTRTLGIKNIIAQMKKDNVQRIIAVGGMGVLNADEITLIVDTENAIQSACVRPINSLTEYQNSCHYWNDRSSSVLPL